MPQICAFLARAEAWLAHGVNDPAMSLGMEDYESHVRMFAAGVRGVAIPEPLFSYRKRPGSMSKAFDPHGMAYLYRRIWQANPELLRRYGPELVGLYAENGHGALAPSVGVESPAHAALFRRDIPDLCEVADDLEAKASLDRLGRALRGRCAVGGAEWDYNTARLLMALGLEPAFARRLLRSATCAEPQNGWFRLYALITEIRSGRPEAAEALWSEDFEVFCRREAGSVQWIVALEAARGHPQVVDAIAPRLGALGLAPPAAEVGPFAALHAALASLRAKLPLRDRAGVRQAEAQVLAVSDLSPEAGAALIARWRSLWRDDGVQAAASWPDRLLPRRLAAALGSAGRPIAVTPAR